MKKQSIIPAQIRAARALLGWSQDNLATEAGVALTSVRDLEAEKRAGESGTSSSVRKALENGGVIFVSGESNAGPGVRLVAKRPNIVRRPTAGSMMKWDGMPLEVEFKGKTFTAFISREAIEDLGRLKGTEPPEQWVKVFDKNEGTILDGIVDAFTSDDRWDEQGRLYVTSSHIAELRG